MRHQLFATLALAGLPALLPAQSLTKTGGALPGDSSFEIRAGASEPYLLILALELQTTPIASLGVTLDVSGAFASAGFTLPGFFGSLSPAGEATAVLPLPGLPELAGLEFVLQAIVGDSPGFDVTNFVRLTPQLAGSFTEAFEEPGLPILGGATVETPTGELLFVGGSGPLAQSYDVQTETFDLAGASLGVGILSQATSLADGRVLFTGGLGLDGQPTAAAALYDPATGMTTTLSMSEARAGHGAALLGDGRVLVTGGLPSFDLADPLGTLTSISPTTELFDPATDTFSAGPALLEPRAFHTATSLSTGDVLIAGGFSLIPFVNIPTVSSTAYRFSQGSSSFGLPAFMNGGRAGHSAIGLPDGRVLLVGGLTIDFSTFLTTGNIADLVIGTRDDAQIFRVGLFGLGNFTTVGGLQESRAGAGLALLPNGEVLVAGGFRLGIDLSGAGLDLGVSSTADVFATGPDRFEATGSMAAGRLFPLLQPLSDGTVLVVGGGAGSTEVYQR